MSVMNLAKLLGSMSLTKSEAWGGEGKAKMEIVEYDRSQSQRAARLQGQLGYPIDPERFHQRIQRLLDRGGFTMLTLVENREVRGFIAFEYLLTLQYDEPICHIMNLVVDRASRGLGYGRQLLDHVSELARAKNAPILHLTSGNKPERMAAHSFYEKYGFVKSGSRFTKNLD